MLLPLLGMGISSAFSHSAASSDQQSREKMNAQQLAFAEKQFAWNKYAQNQAVRIRAADAKAAGIHPLAALGINPASGSSVSVGSMDTGAGDAMKGLGQNIERAINTVSTDRQRMSRMADLSEENAKLRNDMLRAQISSINISNSPPVPSASGLGFLSGQGNSSPTTGGYVVEGPLQRIHSSKGKPHQEVGHVSDVGYAKTPTGLAPVPSKDVKEKIEDQLIPQLAWGVRNLFMPNVSMDPKLKPSKRLLPKGYSHWTWSYGKQEWQPARAGQKSFRRKAVEYFKKMPR